MMGLEREGIIIVSSFVLLLNLAVPFWVRLKFHFLFRIGLLAMIPAYLVWELPMFLWIFFPGNWALDLAIIHQGRRSGSRFPALPMALFWGEIISVSLLAGLTFIFSLSVLFFFVLPLVFHLLHCFLLFYPLKKNCSRPAEPIWNFSCTLVSIAFFLWVFFPWAFSLFFLIFTQVVLGGVTIWVVRQEIASYRNKVLIYKRKLLHSGREYRRIFEYSPAMYVMLDHSFRIMDSNKKFQQAVGLPIEEVVGQSLMEFVPETYQNKLDLLKSYLNYHKGASGEFALINKKKKDSIDVFISVICDEDLTFVIMQDITAIKWMQNSLSSYAEQLKKEMENAKIADKMKSIFLANTSHEIRTPLTSILGFAALLQETELAEVQRDYLDKITTSGEHLLKIINDIIDLSKIEAGKMDVEKEQVNLNRVFKEVYDIVYPQIKKKRLKLLMHLGGTLRKRFVHLDGFRLKQVIINLASNALKFTESGHISLKGERRGGQIIFEVEDTGIGIAQEKQKSIFNPFEQGENSLDRRYGGTGLGLAISKRLVEIMGGEITLESKLKKGTRIRVCFPESIMGEKIPRELEKIEFAAIHETYAGKPSENTPPAAVGGEREEKEKPLLLVGEDDDAVYILLNFTFEKYGISAVRGKDGKEAWDLFEKHRSSIGAVLLDINLPEIDGIDLARRIKREEPELPVIGFSAYDYQEVKERAGDVLDGYIKKPFKIQDVYSMLKKYL